VPNRSGFIKFASTVSASWFDFGVKIVKTARLERRFQRKTPPFRVGRGKRRCKTGRMDNCGKPGGDYSFFK
jgi:hypothetical protein